MTRKSKISTPGLVALIGLSLAAVVPPPSRTVFPVQGYRFVSLQQPCAASGLCETVVHSTLCTDMGSQLYGKAHSGSATCDVVLYRLP